MDGNKKLTGIVFAGIFTLALTACKVQLPNYVGLYVDHFISVTDSTDPGAMPLNMEDSVMAHVVDTTVYVEAELQEFLNPAEETLKISSDSIYQPEGEKLFNPNTDSVHYMRYQIIDLQKQLAVTPDTIFMGEKSQEFQLLNSQPTEYQNQQLQRTPDEQTQMRQNQLKSMQKSAASTPQQTYIPGELIQVQPLSSQQNNHLTQQISQAQNDTIQFLKSQIQNLQPEPQITDTIGTEKEAKEIQPAKELVNEQGANDLKALQDTIQFLKTRLQSLEKQTGIDVPEVEKVTYNVKTDTALIVAFFNRGEIKPREIKTVLNQIKEFKNNKNVTKIALSGYTDSSGSETINKEITNKRLNYLSEKMNPWFPKEKIFFQNFGDTFASDTMVNDERRIEIRIHTK